MSPGEGNLERLERSEALDARAREVRWAPRVPLHKIRRLYETDALGLVDEEQIDDVGYALLARCQSVLEATEAHHHGRLRCPRCRAAIQRRGRPDRPQDDAEEVRCGTCGWATTARAYRATYRGKQLLGENALPAFDTFLRDFQRATSPQEKMLAIDRLIHAVHGGLALGWVGRLAAQVEEIEATQGRFRLLVSCVAEADAPTMSDLRALAHRVREAFGGGGDRSRLQGTLDEVRRAARPAPG